MSTSPTDQLAALVRRMAAKGELNDLLQRVVDASVDHVDGAQYAGITVLTKTSAVTPVTTDELVCLADERQYQTGEGPCLTAAIDHQAVVKVDDLSTDPRWPRFSQSVAELGLRSVLSFQLYTHRHTLGALNLYASPTHAFNDESIDAGVLLATHAAITATAAVEAANLRIALQSRDLIGQAKGILMERHKITADAAFDLLIQASQRTNRKLRDVAYDTATTGELPGDALGTPGNSGNRVG